MKAQLLRMREGKQCQMWFFGERSGSEHVEDSGVSSVARTFGRSLNDLYGGAEGKVKFFPMVRRVSSQVQNSGPPLAGSGTKGTVLWATRP